MFLTKIFHPNVSKTGEICVNTLKKDWNEEHGIKHILLVRYVRALLLRASELVHSLISCALAS